MRPKNEMAFKEWAVICDALGRGEQSVILRKGGIHEGRDGFRVAHPEFWLFPTYLHESEGQDRGTAAASESLSRVVAERPPSGQLRIDLYAVVADVFEVRDPGALGRIAGLHVWSEQAVQEKFLYRQPGLFALTVRIYRRERPLIIADSPHFAGCRSWVDLPQPLPTEGLRAVLNDDQFNQQRRLIARAIQPGVTV